MKDITFTDRIKESLLYLFQKLFVLAEDHIGLNISKVLAVANIAGFMYSVVQLDGDRWITAICCVVMFGVLAAFFMTMVVMIEDDIDFALDEEDDL